jgi:hypothetical protein
MIDKTRLLLCAFAAACSAPEKARDGMDELVADVTLQEGEWRVAYSLPSSQDALLFDRAPGSRPGRWKALGPEVQLEHLGGFDAVLMDRPMQRFALSIEPYTAPIPADYTPFIPFSDGSYAVFTGQFGLLSAANRQAIASLDGTFAGWDGEQFPLVTRLTLDRTMVTKDGSVEAGETYEAEGGTIVYVGDIEPFETGEMTLVVDPGLPAWLRASLVPDLERVFEQHSRCWGRKLSESALLFLAFRGAEEESFSNSGSVAGRVLGASLSGKALLSESQAVKDYLTWFFAHEAAHLYQNDAGTPLHNNEDAWMHEGVASYLANRITEELSPGTGGFRRAQDQSAVACAEVLASQDGATVAGGGRTYEIAYDCGALIAEITDLLTPMRIEQFWTEAGEAFGTQRPFGTEDFFAALAAAGVPPEGVAALRGFITLPQPDAALAIEDLYSVAEGIR